MKDIHKIKTRPDSSEKNIICGDNYRITVLTEGLIRLEYSEDNQFEDRATQMVLNRNFADADFRVLDGETELQIHTSRIHLRYNKKQFSDSGLSIQVKGNLSLYHSIWRYGEAIDDLKGTARTLDFIDGECELDHGIVSKFGYSVIDDSKSLTIKEDGWVEPRKDGVKDLYFFGYAHDYLECLKDFSYLCGKTPMLPRYALGNWWSRYYAYSEETYKELIERFDEEKVPFSVAVIDMDWHVTDIDPKYGNGWTGYTWNKELFPEPERFLRWLQSRGLKTTLNVHPAEGLRAYEDAYEEFADELGVDKENEDPIGFDMTNPDFMEGYFKYMHHPHEAIGVDFWWVDWQQGGKSKIPGLDPLWMLNHFHTLDCGRDGKRPMILSRYAGPGSHRYPIGFSGDSITTWASFDFQPYFTSTASNIGYGWWSHDIGGHMRGTKDDEMAARWVQFGVFSPINRLHSANGEFSGKQPWRYKLEANLVMKKFMQLRHQMLPYLYTMNHKAYQEDIPLIQPMYYQHAEEEEAYLVKNQYYFGSELIVHPVTTPRIPLLNAGKVRTWLPEGIYFDIFTHTVYEGGRVFDMYRTLDSIPVLAKAGAIIPMTEDIYGGDALQNPEHLTIHAYAGADNMFTLYEDDNESRDYEDGQCVTTEFEMKWSDEKCFVIHPAKGTLTLIPNKRSYQILLHGITEDIGTVLINGLPSEIETLYDVATHCLEVSITDAMLTDQIEIQLEATTDIARNEIAQQLFPIIDQMNIGFELKEELFALIKNKQERLYLISELKAKIENNDLLGWLSEIITAYSK